MSMLAEAPSDVGSRLLIVLDHKDSHRACTARVAAATWLIYLTTCVDGDDLAALTIDGNGLNAFRPARFYYNPHLAAFRVHSRIVSPSTGRLLRRPNGLDQRLLSACSAVTSGSIS